jgi:hypothetical protein
MAHNIRRFTISSSYTFLGITPEHARPCPLAGGPHLSASCPARSLPLSFSARWDKSVGANSLRARVAFSHCPADPARSPVHSFARSLSLARGPCSLDPSSSSATVVPMACALPARPVPTSAHPTHVARALGKAPRTPSARPCLTFVLPLPSHSPNRGAVSPSPSLHCSAVAAGLLPALWPW